MYNFKEAKGFKNKKGYLMSENKIIETIYKAIEEVNIGMDEKLCTNSGPNLTLYGEGSPLDSLGLVSLIVNIESNIEDAFNTTISLANEKAVSQKNSPFKTVGSLATYINTLLGKDND